MSSFESTLIEFVYNTLCGDKMCIKNNNITIINE